MYQYCILRRHIELNRDRYCHSAEQSQYTQILRSLRITGKNSLPVHRIPYRVFLPFTCQNELCGTHILPMQSKSWKSYIPIGLLQIFKYWRWCTRINFHFMFLISSLSSQIYLVTDNKWYCFINWFIFFAYIGDSTSSISRKHGTSVSEA